MILLRFLGKLFVVFWGGGIRILKGWTEGLKGIAGFTYKFCKHYGERVLEKAHCFATGLWRSSGPLMSVAFEEVARIYRFVTVGGICWDLWIVDWIIFWLHFFFTNILRTKSFCSSVWCSMRFGRPIFHLSCQQCFVCPRELCYVSCGTWGMVVKMWTERTRLMGVPNVCFACGNRIDWRWFFESRSI